MEDFEFMLSLVPQIWHCSQCEWSGAIPTHYVRNHFIPSNWVAVNRESVACEGELVPRDAMPWPTCVNCGGHRFYRLTYQMSDQTVEIATLLSLLNRVAALLELNPISELQPSEEKLLSDIRRILPQFDGKITYTPLDDTL